MKVARSFLIDRFVSKEIPDWPIIPGRRVRDVIHGGVVLF